MKDIKKLRRLWPIFLLVLLLALLLAALKERKIIFKKALESPYQVNVRLDPATGSYTVNENFPVSVRIESGNLPISGFQIDLSFDPQTLEIIAFDSSVFETILTNSDMLGNATGMAHLVSLAYPANNNPLPVGDFVAGTITVKGRKESSSALLTIDKSKSLFSGEGITGGTAPIVINEKTDANLIIAAPTPTPTTTPISTVTPSVTVTPTASETPMPTVTETLTPTPSSTPLPTVTPSLTPFPTLSPTPTATNTPTPTPLAPVCECPAGLPAKSSGNANCDTKIDLLDFEIWREEAIGIRPTQTADFDCKNGVTQVDFDIWKAELTQGI